MAEPFGLSFAVLEDVFANSGEFDNALPSETCIRPQTFADFRRASVAESRPHIPCGGTYAQVCLHVPNNVLTNSPTSSYSPCTSCKSVSSKTGLASDLGMEIIKLFDAN